MMDPKAATLDIACIQSTTAASSTEPTASPKRPRVSRHSVQKLDVLDFSWLTSIIQKLVIAWRCHADPD
jgi:hypothetical protein